MLMVQDLNREQLDELKTSYFWQDETQIFFRMISHSRNKSRIISFLNTMMVFVLCRMIFVARPDRTIEQNTNT